MVITGDESSCKHACCRHVSASPLAAMIAVAAASFRVSGAEDRDDRRALSRDCELPWCAFRSTHRAAGHRSRVHANMRSSFGTLRAARHSKRIGRTGAHIEQLSARALRLLIPVARELQLHSGSPAMVKTSHHDTLVNVLAENGRKSWTFPSFASFIRAGIPGSAAIGECFQEKKHRRSRHRQTDSKSCILRENVRWKCPSFFPAAEFPPKRRGRESIHGGGNWPGCASQSHAWCQPSLQSPGASAPC
jgi:hypothetical protein